MVEKASNSSELKREQQAQFPLTKQKKPSSSPSTASEKSEEQFSSSWLNQQDYRHQIHGMSHPSDQLDQVIWESGKNSVLFDTEGQQYIDALGGLFCCHIGHGREEMARAAMCQMSKLEFMATLSGHSNPLSIRLTSKIIELVQRTFPNFSSVFLTSGGSEANEAAYHFAVQCGERFGREKTKCISFENCYHGSTLFSMSTNSHIDFGVERVVGRQKNSSSHFVHIPFPNPNFFPMDDVQHGESLGEAAARKLEQAIVDAGGADKVACFLFEPIQGDGGAVIPHDDFFKLAREICNRYNVLMIADEVMTGFGKTGKWFAMEHWNVAPDIITFAKGVSSGYLPMGGVILSDQVQRHVFFDDNGEKKKFKHDYTFASHATCCAVALKNLEILERENLVEQCREKGFQFLKLLMDRLSNLSVVKDVRGAGLLLGIELHRDDIATDIEKRMLKEEKIVVHAAMNGKVIDLAPSFVTSQEQFEQIANGLFNVLRQYSE